MSTEFKAKKAWEGKKFWKSVPWLIPDVLSYVATWPSGSKTQSELLQDDRLLTPSPSLYLFNIVFGVVEMEPTSSMKTQC